jgi:hypothetical protein
VTADGPDRDGHCGGHRRCNYPSWWRLDCVVDRSKAQLHLAEVFKGAELVWLVEYLGDDAGSADPSTDRQVLLFMDLPPKRSFVKYAVSRRITIFVISWRNPGPEDREFNLTVSAQPAVL